jgi:hypothetical protein
MLHTRWTTEAWSQIRKLALAHAPQHSPVYIAGDGARFTIRHDG